MADNSAQNNANTPVSNNTVANADTPSATVFSPTPADYAPLNAHEAKAAAIAANAQVGASSPLPYEGGISGAEQVAKSIVDSTRSADAQVTTGGAVASNGQYDLLDSQNVAANNDLNAIAPAAGRPFNGANGKMGSLNAAVNTDALSQTLNKPNAGRTTVVDVDAGDRLVANFDPNSADLSMKGKDLVMSFNDGSKIVLQDFAEDTQNMPLIILPNGAIVAGGVIVAQLQGTTDVFDLETAAGAAGAEGGSFIYNDDLGSVIGLLNKLPPIPFTALQFGRPDPQVVLNDIVNDPIGGTFVPGFETLAGILGSVAGGFEDWAPFQNAGDYTQYPMALNIAFTPQDNEVVDQVTISNIPAGTQFFYGTTNAYVPVPVVNGTVTFSGAQLAAGNIFVLPPTNSDTDLPMTITLTASDPDVTGTIVLTQNIVAIIDAAADRPVVVSGLSASSGMVAGNNATVEENSTVNINVDANFPDSDGSEVHTVVISGVPADWNFMYPNFGPNPPYTYSITIAADGTQTITFTPSDQTNPNFISSFEFMTNEMTGTAQLTLAVSTQEKVTDGELTLSNNTATILTQFTVSIEEDVPVITAVSNNLSIPEENLLIPGIDQVTGSITVDYQSDGLGDIALSLNGLSALGLTSNGEALNYALSADGNTITATDAGGNVVFTIGLGASTNNPTPTSEYVVTTSYTFTLFQPLDHVPGGGKNGINIPVQFVATDSDGDTVGGTLTVGVVDDVPVAADASATVDETNFGDGSGMLEGPTGFPNNALPVILGVGVTGQLNTSFGADGPGAITGTGGFTATGSVAGGTLMSGGNPVTVTYENGVYTGRAGAPGSEGALAFILKVKPDGSYEFDQYMTLDHADGSNPDDVISLNFGYQVTDFDGDTATATLTINVRDDAPIARDDNNALADGQTIATGNVMTGENGGPNAADTASNDGTLLKDVTAYGVTKSFATPDGTDNNGKFVLINGQYGQLKIYENGSYAYTYNSANSSGNHSEVFAYVLIDGDKDTSTANLTLRITDNGPGEAPNIERTVDETFDLNNTFSDTIVVSGATSFALGASNGGLGFSSDGSQTSNTLSSNGVPVTVSLVNGQYVGMAGNTVVFTLSINNNGTYSFVQKAVLDHANGSNPDDVINLHFSYKASDADGDTSGGQITIHVRDDAPVAYDDHNTIPDGQNTATGNVITGLNGGPGAADDTSNDNPNLIKDVSANGVTKSFATDGQMDAEGKFVTINGDHGVLKIYQDGHYSYTYDGSSAQTQPQSYGGGGQQSWAGVNLFAFDMDAAFQDGSGHLLLGNAGQDGAAIAYTVHGIGVISNDANPLTGYTGGYEEVNYDPNRIQSEAIGLQFGFDSTHAVISLGSFYSSVEGPDPGTEYGQWYAYDANGNLVATGQFNAADLPGPAFGQAILTIDTDEAFRTLVFKSLPINNGGNTSRPEGSDFYIVDVTATPVASECDDDFTYTLIDDDGDTSQANICFDIKDNGPGQPPSIDRVIDETTDLNNTFSDTIVVSGATSFALGASNGGLGFSSDGSQTGGTLSSNGVPVTVSLVNGQYVGTANGVTVFTLSINNNGTYSFVQKAVLDHADGSNPDDVINLRFKYTASDNDGDKVQGDITIHVRDDAPVAYDDHNTIPDGQNTATGNVITGLNGGPGAADDTSNDNPNLIKDVSANGVTKSFATDGQMDAEGKFVTINGDHGVLKIYQDGHYSYTYDGSAMANGQNFGSNGFNPENMLTRWAGVNFFAFDANAAFQDANGHLQLGNSGQNGATVSVMTQGLGVTSNNDPYGEVTEGGSLSEALVAQLPITTTDAIVQLGLFYSASETPDLNTEVAQWYAYDANGNLVGTGRVTADQAIVVDAQNGIRDFAIHTDSPFQYILLRALPQVSGNQDSNGGNQDSNYVLNGIRIPALGDCEENFTYTLIDKDGDTSQANLCFDIKDNGPGTAPNIARTIDETSDLNNTFSDSIVVAGASSFALGTVTGASAFSSGGSQTGGTLSSHGVPVTVALVGGKYVGMAGGVEVFTLTINNNGTYSFVQKAQLDHADGSNPNDVISLNFHYTARDADGDASEGQITISVRDDAPVAYNDHNMIDDNSNIATGNVITGQNGGPGAADDTSVDQPNLLKDVSAHGVTKSFSAPDGIDGNGKFVIINGEHGELKIYENGSYTYSYDGSAQNPPAQTFGGGGQSTWTGVNLFAFDMDAAFQDSNGHLLLNNAGQDGAVISYTGSGIGVVSNDAPYPLPGYTGGYDEVNYDPNRFQSEALAIQFGFDSKHAVVNFSSFYTSTEGPDPGTEYGQWYAYDANGNLVATGQFNSADLPHPSFGQAVLTIDTDAAFHTLVFRSLPINNGGNTSRPEGSDYYITSISATPVPPTCDDKFAYTLVDNDGDTSQAILCIDIVDGRPIAPEDICVNVYEQAGVLSQGQFHVDGATSFALGHSNGTGGFSAGGNITGGTTLMSHGVPVIVSLINGAYVGKANDVEVFKLSIDQTGHYTLTQSQSLDHDSGMNAYFDPIDLYFSYTARDGNGDAVEGTIQFKIQDDSLYAQPDFNSMTADISTGAGMSVNGNIKTNDTFGIDGEIPAKWVYVSTFGGASGANFSNPTGSDAGGVYVVVNGRYGDLKLYEDGNYSYTLRTVQQQECYGFAQEQFQMLPMDGDGDAVETRLTIDINFQDSSRPPVFTLFADETTDVNKSLGGAINLSGVSSIAAGDENGAAHFHTDLFVKNGTLTSQGVPVIVSIVNGQYVGMAGNKEVFTLSINNGGYNFVLKSGLDHALWYDTDEKMDLYFGYTVTYANGSKGESCIQINLADDVNGYGGHYYMVSNVNDVVAGNAMADLPSVSADGFVGFYMISPYLGNHGAVNFDHPTGQDANGKYLIAQGAYGELKFYENGSYAYTYNGVPENCDNCDKIEMFRISTLDGDGDAWHADSVILYFKIVDHPTGAVMISPNMETHAVIDGNHDVGLLSTVNLDNAAMLNEAAVSVAGVQHNGGTGYDTFDFETGSGYTLVGHDVYHNGVDTGLDMSVNYSGPWQNMMAEILITGHAAGTSYESVLQALTINTLQELTHGQRLINVTTTDDQGHSATQSSVLEINSFGPTHAAAAADLPSYHASASNSLNISDLLSGSSYQAGISHVDDFVKIDHNTGHVMVDTAGTGHFDASHAVATVSNVNAVTSVNVILNDDEGSKIVHTV